MIQKDDNSLNIRFKQVREILKLTQKDIGDIANLSAPQVNQFEKGKAGIRPDSLAALATYGISTDWLLTGEGEPFKDQAKAETYASSLKNEVRRVPTPSLDKIEKDTVPLSLYQTMKAERDRLFDMVDRLTRQLGKYKGVATSTVLAYIGHKIGRTLAMLA